MPATTTGVATSFIDFTRASNATVTDSDGKVKWAPHNLLTNSESFNAASWTKSSVTPTANSIAAPNGTTTADTLAASGANGTTLQTFTAEAVSYTFAVWLKRKTGTGTIEIAADSGTYTAVTITSDWALYTVTQTPTAGSKTAGIRIVTSADEVYAWGASLYRSDLAMQANTSAYPLYNPTTPKNFAGFTEDFSNAAWTKSNTTVGANAILAPNGLQTADLIYPTTTGTNRSVYQASSGKTVSVYAKAAGKSYVAFVDTTGGNVAAWFNLTTGVKGSAIAGYDYDMVDMGSGWYRCWIRRTSGVSFTYAQIYVTDADNSNSVTANGTDGIYLWGAQLSDSASLDSYSPVYGAAVTSAAYYGPRRDFDPVTLACKGLLVEEQRTNSLLQSAEFDTASWNKADLNTSGTPAWVNVAVAPDGTQTADAVVEGSGTVQPLMYQSLSTLSGAVSVYVKSNGRNFVQIVNSSGYANFDLSTGLPGTVSGFTSPIIVPVGSGWYRISTVVPISSVVGIGIVPSSTSSYRASYTGNGTSGIYIWGAQFEASKDFPTSYIPVGSTTAGATRNADVASVSTQAFPYSSTEGTVVASVMFANYVSGDGRIGGVVGFGSSSPRIILAMGSSSNRPFWTQMYDGTNAINLSKPNSSDLSVNTPHKVGTAYTTASGGVSAFTWNGISAASSTNPNAFNLSGMATMQIGNQPDTAAYFNGHIRQITYLPRRISNTELQTRTT